MQSTRTIALFCDSRANWTRAKSVCEAIDATPTLALRLVCIGPMADNGVDYPHTERLYRPLAAGQPMPTPQGMARSAAYIQLAVANWLHVNTPDVVIAMTDRYETLAVATAAALMNIPIAHIQGGELSGTIDESIRHAVTKLSHLHFVATEEAAAVVRSLGEDPRYIFNVGCPATDLLLQVDVSQRPITEPYILFLLHPVTSEWEQAYQQAKATLNGIKAAWDGLVVAIGPNHDAGSDGTWKAIHESGAQVRPSVPPDEFVRLMAHAEVLVGNSSAGIREACYWGVAVLDIGTRQFLRTPRGGNVEWVSACHASFIGQRLERKLRHKRYLPQQLYGDGTAGAQIAQILSTVTLPPVQKRLMQ